jgi:hypothetical protein
MKTIWIILMALLLSAQVWAEQPDSTFRTNDLPGLDLANLGDFWKDDAPPKREDASNAYFQRAAAYLGGLRYIGRNKRVEVAVFRLQDDAVKAMEALRADVASVIVPGETNNFIGLKWWFTSGIPNAIFVNYRNTIVTASCYQPSFAESSALLRKAAVIIVDRIKNATETSNKSGSANGSKPIRSE